MATIVKVQSKEGRPTKGARVCLWMDGGSNHEKYTDEDGEAYFDYGPGHGTLYCDGAEIQKGAFKAHILVTR